MSGAVKMKESAHERSGNPIVEGSRLSCHEAHLRDDGGEQRRCGGAMQAVKTARDQDSTTASLGQI